MLGVERSSVDAGGVEGGLLPGWVFGVVLGVEANLPGLDHLVNIIMPIALPIYNNKPALYSGISIYSSKEIKSCQKTLEPSFHSVL